LKALCVPYPSGRMTCWPVDPAVGNHKNDEPWLVERTRQDLLG
jgi:putative SOS response-associated peptidase YedK